MAPLVCRLEEYLIAVYLWIFHASSCSSIKQLFRSTALIFTSNLSYPEYTELETVGLQGYFMVLLLKMQKRLSWKGNGGGFSPILIMQFLKLCCTSEGDIWVSPIITIRDSPLFDFLWHIDDSEDEEHCCQALCWCVALHKSSEIQFSCLQAALLLLKSHWCSSAEPQLKELSKDHFSS